MNSDLASEILALTGEHLFLVAITILIASTLALPAGVLLSRRPTPRRWAVGFANIAQTIPSLALFGFLVPLPFIKIAQHAPAGIELLRFERIECL